MKDSRDQFLLLLCLAVLPCLLAQAGEHQHESAAPGTTFSVRNAPLSERPILFASERLEGRAGLIQAVQLELASRGYYAGDADGYSGQETRAAVEYFQRDAGLVVDGQVNDELLAELERRAFVGRAYFSVASGRSPSLLGNVQRALTRAGYYQGPADGILNPATRQAIQNYRTMPYEQVYIDGYPRVYEYSSPAVAEEVAASPVDSYPGLATAPGLEAFRAADFALAIQQTSAAVRALNSDDTITTAAFFLRGLAHLELADNAAAVRDFTSMLRLAPQQAEAYYNRSVAYQRAGMFEFARRDYRRAVDLIPELSIDTDALVSLQ